MENNIYFICLKCHNKISIDPFENVFAMYAENSLKV
jgi:hypothetical protein